MIGIFAHLPQILGTEDVSGTATVRSASIVNNLDWTDPLLFILYAGVFFLIIGLISISLAVAVRVWGMGDYQYYPTLQKMDFGILEWSLLAVLLLLQALIAPLSVLKKRLEFD